MIVADAGVEVQHPARAFTVLGGVTTGLHVHRTNRISAHPHEQLSIGGLGDVEAVKQG